MRGWEPNLDKFKMWKRDEWDQVWFETSRSISLIVKKKKKKYQKIEVRAVCSCGKLSSQGDSDSHAAIPVHRQKEKHSTICYILLPDWKRRLERFGVTPTVFLKSLPDHLSFSCRISHFQGQLSPWAQWGHPTRKCTKSLKYSLALLSTVRAVRAINGGYFGISLREWIPSGKGQEFPNTLGCIISKTTAITKKSKFHPNSSPWQLLESRAPGVLLMQVQLIPSQHSYRQLGLAKPAWKILWCAHHHHFPSSLSLLRTWGISKMWTLHSEEAFGRAAINLLGLQGSEIQEGGAGEKKERYLLLKAASTWRLPLHQDLCLKFCLGTLTTNTLAFFFLPQEMKR